MAKHKLFLEDSKSFFNLSKVEISEGSTAGNFMSCFVNKPDPINFSEGAERRTRLINIPGAKKNMKKTKLNYNSPTPSSSKDCHPAFISEHTTPEPDTKTTNLSEDTAVVRNNSEKKNFKYDSSSSLEDFNSDKMEVDFKFSQKLPYSKQEDEWILQYVLKGQNIFKVGSISLWKYLEYKKDNPKRTYHSLKNRFLRNIRPCLLTKYRHFIKNKETVDNILAKFPELKKQMGIRNTLSKIDLLTRKSPSKLLKTGAQASKEYEENIKRTTPERALESSDIINPIVQPSQESLQSNPTNNARFHRKVNFGKKSIFVSVILTDRNHSERPISSVMKIGERFEKLRKKKERHFCPACGRYNRNLREGDSSESDKESDIMILNSVDEEEKSLKNLRKKTFNSNLNNNQKTNHKISPSKYSSCSRDSQSLLSYDNEIYELDKPPKNANEDIGKISNHSKSLTSKKKTIKVENVTKKIQVQEKSKTIISEKEADLVTEKQWDNDSEIDIIYESAMVGFRKLIDADEEKMLFRKCLYKNRDSIGFNSDSEKNLDSYFLESSPEVETPTLTENYSTLPQNESGRTGSQNAYSSNLASNMMKMLAKEKNGNKKS